MPNEHHYRGTREQLHELLHSFVGALAGNSGEFAPYVQGIRLRIGLVALSCIQEAFIAKAAGGAGDDGITWEALKPETIAARPIGQGDVASLKGSGITKRKHGFGARKQGAGDLDAAGRLKRGFLTDAQDKRWRMIFATRKWQMMAAHGMSEGAASARAAQIAWATLKSEGAKTRLQMLGSRTVQIGRNSGRLLLSLSPGTDDPDRHPLLSDAPAAEDGILRIEDGAIIVGSSVPYAAAFHAKRQLWPESMPAAWDRRISEATETGVREAIEMILQGPQPARKAA